MKMGFWEEDKAIQYLVLNSQLARTPGIRKLTIRQIRDYSGSMTILLTRWFIGTNTNPIFTLTICYIYFSFIYTCNNILFILRLYILCTRIIILRLVLEDAKIGWVQLYTYFHQWNQISINNGVPYNLRLWFELVWQLQKVFWPLIFCIYLFSSGIRTYRLIYICSFCLIFSS